MRVQTLTMHHWPRRNATVEDVIHFALRDGRSDISDGPECAHPSAPFLRRRAPSPREHPTRAPSSPPGRYAQHLQEAVAEGRTDMSMVRRALAATMRIRFRLGQFDAVASQPYLALGADDINDGFARRLNHDVARQSLVLLQNGNGSAPPVLPFGAPRRVAVIGPLANSSAVLKGSYARRIDEGAFPSLLDAISTLVGSGAEVSFAPGVRCAKPGCSDLAADQRAAAEAVALADAADAVVLMVGTQSVASCGDAQCGYEAEQHDRFGLGLPPPLEALVKAVLAGGGRDAKTAVVLVHGGALALEEGIKGTRCAILDAHFPGGETGAAAVADALFGRYNPGGKLTYSVMPSSFAQLSWFPSMSMSSFPGRSYRFYPTNSSAAPPLWSFGHGLSYSRFSLACVTGGGKEESSVAVRCDVTNTGSLDGDEVVMLFDAPITRASAEVPTRQLIDFERVHVHAGRTATVAFMVAARQLLLQPGAGRCELVASRGHGEEVRLSVDLAGA